jgi:hypothetical protein
MILETKTIRNLEQRNKVRKQQLLMKLIYTHQEVLSKLKPNNSAKYLKLICSLFPLIPENFFLKADFCF